VFFLLNFVKVSCILTEGAGTRRIIARNIASNFWDWGSHTEQHLAQLLMQHVTQPCTHEFICNQNKHGVGSHETEKLPQLSFVALLDVSTKLNNFAVTTVLVILLEERTTKIS